MILPDVNVLIYAHRKDAVDHTRYRSWLQEVIQTNEPYGMSDHVLSSFLRIVSHQRIFSPPSTTEQALKFTSEIREPANCRRIVPGPRHWDFFTNFCRSIPATGDLIPDAWLAALAIESGCELITTDRDYQKFPGLRWRHPLTGKAVR